MGLISIIICTYNPIEETFSLCLKKLELALDSQSGVEIIFVDNNSTIKFWDFDFFYKFTQNHKVRVVKEINQGLTSARLKGISESRGDLLVFIDDDNLVAADFFLNVIRIHNKHPWIGSFSGSVKVVSDSNIPEWTKSYWGMLVHREIEKDSWSNVPFDQNCMPCGAGLVVTREVALYYLNLIRNGHRSFQLDRIGNQLLSGGDNDLAMCACDLGLGMGVFHALKMEHILPHKRFEYEYLKNLAFNIYYSAEILKGMRGVPVYLEHYFKYLAKLIYTFRFSYRDGSIQRACLRGSRSGIMKFKSII